MTYRTSVLPSGLAMSVSGRTTSLRKALACPAAARRECFVALSPIVV